MSEPTVQESTRYKVQSASGTGAAWAIASSHIDVETALVEVKTMRRRRPGRLWRVVRREERIITTVIEEERKVEESFVLQRRAAGEGETEWVNWRRSNDLEELRVERDRNARFNPMAEWRGREEAIPTDSRPVEVDWLSEPPKPEPMVQRYNLTTAFSMQPLPGDRWRLQRYDGLDQEVRIVRVEPKEDGNHWVHVQLDQHAPDDKRIITWSVFVQNGVLIEAAR